MSASRPTYDPVCFDAGRYRDENLAFWVPRFVEAASIGEGDVVVDLGCGTGGFTAALGPNALGVEIDPGLVGHGRTKHVSLSAAVGDVTRAPLRTGGADVVLASLLFHQAPVATLAAEVARLLRPGGRLLVRTVTPDDAADWIPHRWFPTVAAAQRRRMPPIDVLCAELTAAGLDVDGADVTFVERAGTIDGTAVEAQARNDVLPRFDLAPDELDAGLAALRAAHGEPFVRRHALLVAARC